ncbi:MAG: D-alanyl-lipoteichoic acid biosynthesis protein DltD [Caldilineaceae bacterium]
MIKLLLLLLLLLAGQMAVAYFYPSEVPEPVLHFQTLLDDGREILYLGDSTLWHPVGTQTTAEMLQELLPTYSIGELSHAAYGMDVFRSYIDYMLRQEQRPAVVIIPINLRSFSPEWDLRPGYQFTREKRVLGMGISLTRLLGRPLRLFGGYETDITQDEFLHSTVYASGTPIGQVQDFEGSVGASPLEDNGSEQFVYYQDIPNDADYQRLLSYYYMNAITPDHRKIQAMVDIAQRLQAADIEVIFYITPVNVELGDVYIGDTFRHQFAENVAVIQEQLAAQGVDLLDLSFDLAAYFFSDTEHLRQTGKRYIAEKLATVIDPAAMAPTPTPEATAVPPLLVATPTPPDVAAPGPTASGSPLPNTVPANPLLATTIARATQAAGGAVTATPTAPPAVTPTPIANPLLATAFMRATTAAQP